MALTDKQIERYSRQILVAGGVAQERLLAARITISGTASAVEPALRYLVGAGVGRIGLHLIGEDSAARDQLVATARALDASVAIEDKEPGAVAPDLRLMIIGNADVLAALRSQRAETWNAPLVAIRLDPPARILVMPEAGCSSPMLEAELLAPWSPSAPRDSMVDEAGFVTMVAVTEVLKLLMQDMRGAETIMVEFAGYQTRTRRLVYGDQPGR
ncbi:MAG: hypothetical protein ACLQBA_23040 [Candidatus Binataceae bacterium]